MNEQQSSRSCAEYIRGRIKHYEYLIANGKNIPVYVEELYWYKEILRNWQSDHEKAFGKLELLDYKPL